jgi:hypothetical protein
MQYIHQQHHTSFQHNMHDHKGGKINHVNQAVLAAQCEYL